MAYDDVTNKEAELVAKIAAVRQFEMSKVDLMVLADAIDHDRRTTASTAAAAAIDERLAKLEQQTRALAAAVVAISDMFETIVPTKSGTLTTERGGRAGPATGASAR